MSWGRFEGWLDMVCVCVFVSFFFWWEPKKWLVSFWLPFKISQKQGTSKKTRPYGPEAEKHVFCELLWAKLKHWALVFFGVLFKTLQKGYPQKKHTHTYIYIYMCHRRDVFLGSVCGDGHETPLAFKAYSRTCPHSSVSEWHH